MNPIAFFFSFLFALLVGCAPTPFDAPSDNGVFDEIGTVVDGGTTSTPPDQIGEVVETDNVNVKVTLSVLFDDPLTWPVAMVTCYPSMEVVTAGFDGEGWATFTQDFSACEGLSFNFFGVGGSVMSANTNPAELAEIAIDEASDTTEGEGQPDLEPLLHLWVFEGDYNPQGDNPMLEPSTINAPEGSFWGCDEPLWSSPYGMPYARANAEADVDLCESTPPE